MLYHGILLVFNTFTGGCLDEKDLKFDLLNVEIMQLKLQYVIYN